MVRRAGVGATKAGMMGVDERAEGKQMRTAKVRTVELTTSTYGGVTQAESVVWPIVDLKRSGLEM
jgi:hypothetical protein